MSNPPLHLKMEPSPGSDIGDCFDQALQIAHHIRCVVDFDFNEVFCGVRPSDHEGLREVFVNNYHREMSRKFGCKICYANP